MRLIDKVKVGIPKAHRKELDKLIYVDLDNVLRAFISDCNDGKVWSLDDFPTILPPWPLSWFEYRMNSKDVLETEAGSLSISSPKQQVGFFCQTIDFGDAGEHEAVGDIVLQSDYGLFWLQAQEIITKEQFKSHVAWSAENGRAERLKGYIGKYTPRWMFFFTCFATNRKKVLLPGMGFFYLDELGNQIPETLFSIWGPDTLLNTDEIDGDPKNFIRPVMSMLMPVLFGISLLHCKNVEIAGPRNPNRGRAKKRRRQGMPPVEFKTLVVHSMTKASTEGRGQHSTPRWHIARGHFKDYRRGKGLFGHLREIFWWDSHVRGNRSKGTIEKDYDIDPDIGSDSN